ncbi:MAG: MFS transporter [Chloroflexota bacterium]|nr:MFS transporter [Chloroflexota bacterium]
MKFFYGWWIVLAAILCQFASMSVGQAVIGVFMNPVIDDLGWKVWEFTLGSSLAVGAGAISAMVAGRIVDSKGPRPLILIGSVVSGICLFLLSLQSNLFVFLALYSIAGLVGWNFFGPPVINATLSKWFIAQRGWALSLGSIGISLAGLITPFLMTVVVDSFSWRTGYTTLGISVVVLLIPIAFVMRRRPEDYGLQPDGKVLANGSPQDTKINQIEGTSLTVNEAIRTKSFWSLVFGFGLIMGALMSVLIHAIPFTVESGFSRTIAAAAITVNGVGNLSGKFFWGYALQRFDPRKLVFLAYSLSALGVALMLSTPNNLNITILFSAFFLYGLGFGGTIPLSQFLWAKYFGRTHIGAINGVAHPMTTLSTALAPVLVGYGYDVYQTYLPAFILIICAYILGAFIVLISKEPVLVETSKSNI